MDRASAKQKYVSRKPYVQSLADKLKLQLSKDDFKMVTEKTEALR